MPELKSQAENELLLHAWCSGHDNEVKFYHTHETEEEYQIVMLTESCDRLHLLSE